MQSSLIASVLLFALSFGVKSIIHAVLDSRNGYKIDYASARGFIYFLPYEKDVSKEDEKLKKACNIFQKLSMLFLIMLVIIYFFRFIKR